jgi:hypothetical protein
MPQKQKKVDLQPVNFYEVLKKEGGYLQETHNPHYDEHKIKLPFQMIIAGKTGSFKTNTILNLLRVTPDTWSRFVYVTKDKDEPLLNYLADKVPDVEIYEGLQKLPNLSDFDKTKNNLVVVDDMVAEKNQEIVNEFVIRCRKKGCSIIYCTQDWYKSPQTFRKNLSHIILKRIPKASDLDRIMRDYSLDVDKDTLRKIYKYASVEDDKGNETNFLLIDLNNKNPNEVYRRNFEPINLDEFKRMI